MLASLSSANGELEWLQQLSSAAEDWLPGITLAEPGSFLIRGTARPEGSLFNQTYVAAFNEDGTRQWLEWLPRGDDSSADSVVFLPSSQRIFAAGSISYTVSVEEWSHNTYLTELCRTAIFNPGDR